MKFRYSMVLTFIFLLVLVPGVSAKNQDALWPTKEFEVRWYSPSVEDRLFELRPWLRSALLSAEEKARMQETDDFMKASLREIAVFFDSAGLGSPNLPIEKGKDGKKRYIVYAYDFKDSFYTTELEEFGAGYYRGFCVNKVQILFPESVDLDPTEDKLAINVKSLGETRISQLAPDKRREFYSVMAHELFHAIQFSYDAQFSSILLCKDQKGNGRDAVLEGTATAAGALATDDKYPGYIDSLPWHYKNLGAFPYGGKEEFLKVKSDKSVISGDEVALQYKTSSFWRYLVERFAEGEVKYGLSKVFNTLFRKQLAYEGLVNPTLEERYRWLDDGVKGISGSPLYIVFPDFIAEFGSYVPSRYEGGRLKWYNTIFPTADQKCHTVKIDGSGEKYGKIEIIGGIKIERNSATCIDLEWENVAPHARIEIEATYHNEKAIDQLHLGISHFVADGKIDNCYQMIQERVGSNPAERKDLECSFGKLFEKSDPNGTFIKTAMLGTTQRRFGKGEFFARGLGDYGNAALTLVNMAVDQNGTDIPLTDGAEDKLEVKFSIIESEFADGRKFFPPDMIQLRDPAGILGFMASRKVDHWWATPVSYQTPSQTVPVPDRYNMYGIQKKADGLPGGLGTSFQVVSVDDPSKKYTILPLGKEFKYEYTGKVNAVVSNEGTATSVVCSLSGGQNPPVMEVTQSDEKQLRFKIKTDLCKMKPNGQIEVVDKIDAKFVYPFGRRAYPATAPQHIITPGIELYIDEYLKELVRQGVPLAPTVLMSDGSVPGDEDGDGVPDNAPTSDPGDPGDDPGNKTNDTGICDCSCEQYSRIKEMAKNAPRTQAGAKKMRSLMACIQVCATEYGKCKN